MPDSKYRQVLDLAETGCAIIDSQGCLVDANSSYLKLIGRTDVEQIRGRSVMEWTAPVDRERMQEAFQLGLDRGSIKKLEVELLCAEDKTTPIELKATRFLIHGSVGLIVLCHDISDRREILDTMQRQHSELARLGRLETMGELASGLAHELNQPLGAILNYAGVCRELIGRARSQESGTSLSRAVEEIIKESVRAGEIIGRLRAQVRKQEPLRRPVQLDHEIAEVVNLLAFELRAANIRVDLNLDGELVVSADPIEVQQVVTNLLRNAIDALSSVAGQRQIKIGSIAKGNGAVIQITDNGPGISPDLIEKIFDPFYTTKTTGLGVGLAICQSIVRAHGGEIEAASMPGSTTFTFTLPLSCKTTNVPTNSPRNGEACNCLCRRRRPWDPQLAADGSGDRRTQCWRL